jgi:nicotinamidase-related amidase
LVASGVFACARLVVGAGLRYHRHHNPKERAMSEPTLDHAHTALLVADFYAEFMGSLPHSVSRDCVAKAVALLAQARRAGVLVCYSATVFRPDYPEVNERNKIFSARKRSGQPAIADPLTIIHPAVRPAEHEPVIGKRRVNAMFGTDLEILLRARDIHTLIMLGYATSGVILSTTRYAADADYRLLVVEDCCADNDQQVHDFLFAKILPRQADVVQSADVIRALGS